MKALLEIYFENTNQSKNLCSMLGDIVKRQDHILALIVIQRVTIECCGVVSSCGFKVTLIYH